MSVRPAGEGLDSRVVCDRADDRLTGVPVGQLVFSLVFKLGDVLAAEDT